MILAVEKNLILRWIPKTGQGYKLWTPPIWQEKFISNKRKQYNPQFKAKVALEAVRGVKTVPELASQYSLHPTVINNWKRQLIEEAKTLFENSRKKASEQNSQDAQIAELYRQIGQLKVERDFLAKRSEQLGLNLEKPWSWSTI